MWVIHNLGNINKNKRISFQLIYSSSMSRKAGAVPSSSEHKAGTHPEQNTFPSQVTLHTHTPSDWDYIDTPITLMCKTGKWEDIEYLEKTQADMKEQIPHRHGPSWELIFLPSL